MQLQKRNGLISFVVLLFCCWYSCSWWQKQQINKHDSSLPSKGVVAPVRKIHAFDFLLYVIIHVPFYFLFTHISFNPMDENEPISHSAAM